MKNLSDKTTNIEELKKLVKEFCDERDWDQFRNAKDLAISIVTESPELLDHFRFKSEEEVKELFNNKKEGKK